MIGLSLDRGDERSAAVQAEQCGEHWSDPDFELLAAELYIELEEYDSAVKCAEQALLLGSPAWEGALRAYNVLIQASTARGRWAQAAKAAMDVLAKEPENLSAVWVLTLCQYHLGQFEQAWKSYTEVGHRPVPRNEQEARVRIDLWSRFERDASNVETLTSVLGQFPGNRAVKAAVVNALFYLRLDENDTATVEHIRGAIAPLLEELHDVFVQKELDQDNPLASLNELVSDLPDTSEQDSRIEEGRFPLGMAAALHRRSLTEVLASRTSAPLFAGDAEHFETEISAATAMESLVVIDLTALYALSVLDEPLSELLLGRFARPIAARAQLIDSIQGSDHLANLPTLQIGRAADGSAFPVAISTEEAETRHRRAQRIRAQFDNVATNETLDIKHFPELVPDGAWASFAWIAAVDTAIELGSPLWCDDRMTRRLAAEKGVVTFGTQALIESLRRSGVITNDAAVAYQAHLITKYFVGLGFRSDVLTHAAAIDGWKPLGTATFVAHSVSVPDPHPLIEFVMQGIGQSLDYPSSLRDWIGALAFWLVRVAPSTEAAQGNLASLLSMLLQQPWLESSKLPFVLQGIRDGIGNSEIRDPLKDAMEKHYRLLAQQSGWAPAAQRIRDLFALANREDRITATGVVLEVH